MFPDLGYTLRNGIAALCGVLEYYEQLYAKNQATQIKWTNSEKDTNYKKLTQKEIEKQVE